MKLKTFFISYLLFLSILLAAISTISIYLTNHQLQNLSEQNRLAFERISTTILREVNAVYGRLASAEAVDSLLLSHINFHQQQGIELFVEAVDEPVVFEQLGFDESASQLSFSYNLVTDMGILAMQVNFDIAASLSELQNIQQVLLYLFISFSLLATIILYFILAKIFKPFELITASTNKIARGNYSERITVRGNNELSLMANNFNHMAAEIDQHVRLLKDEASRKQQFIDNLAHELRTPLTSIYGYAQYLQNAKLTEADTFESLTIIMEEANYMKQLTNSMLELAKLRNHQPVMHEIVIADLFKQVRNSLEIPLKKYQINFEVTPSDGKINGQVDLIKSLLSNLCINAAKACPQNSGFISLTSKKLSAGCYQFVVTDNGCGIANADLAKLTEPFYQVDTARNKTTQGVGLGLAIVKQIANSHRAKLEITSQLDIGTTVKITFNNG